MKKECSFLQKRTQKIMLSIMLSLAALKKKQHSPHLDAGRHFFKKEVLLFLLATLPAQAQDVVRLPLAVGKFPISAAVTVRGGSDLVFLSGALPSVVNKDAPKGSTAVFGGNTAVQTESALANIKTTLARMGMGMADVIKMNVFLAGDPALGGKMDFAGMMQGYTKYFGTPEQPNLPARSAVQVAALAAPGALVEIEVIAVKPR